MGFEVLDKRELARARERRRGGRDQGRPSASRRRAPQRRVTGFVAFDDPGGNPVELFYGPILDHVPVQTPLVSSFVTGDMGMGHVIVSAEDAEATLDFYIDVLGFVERNTMGRTWFLGCNPRHHTFGIARRRGPGRAAAPDGRGGHARRRRARARSGREARRADDEHARQAHERPDGVVLRVLARRTTPSSSAGTGCASPRSTRRTRSPRARSGATSSRRRPLRPRAPDERRVTRRERGRAASDRGRGDRASRATRSSTCCPTARSTTRYAVQQRVIEATQGRGPPGRPQDRVDLAGRAADVRRRSARLRRAVRRHGDRRQRTGPARPG